MMNFLFGVLCYFQTAAWTFVYENALPSRSGDGVGLLLANAGALLTERRRWVMIAMILSEMLRKIVKSNKCLPALLIMSLGLVVL